MKLLRGHNGVITVLFYREAETVYPRSGQPVSQGVARRGLPASGGKDAVGENKNVD